MNRVWFAFLVLIPNFSFADDLAPTVRAAQSAPRAVSQETATQPSFIPLDKVRGIELEEISYDSRPRGTHVQVGPLPIPIWLFQNQAMEDLEGVSGNCELELDMNSNLKVPCHNIEITLFDKDGLALQSTRTRNGFFAFPTKMKVGHKLAVASAKYEARRPASVDPRGHMLFVLKARRSH